MKVSFPSDQSIGCYVTDVDFNHVDKKDIEQIKELIYSYKAVIVKNQTLNTQIFNDVSYHFGTPIPYLQNNYHHPDYPLIFVSSNVRLNNKSIGVPRTGGYWHSDTAFLEEPIPLTLLYPQIVPKNSLRTTLFIDLEKAYRALPYDFKIELESLKLIHSGRWKYKVRKEDAGLDISEILTMIDQVQAPVSHPAIIKHPVTGNKSIYATRGFTIGVDGKNILDSEKILNRLFDFIEQEEFISVFQWQKGDLILWDNRFLAHKAGRCQTQGMTPTDEMINEEETMVFRIIVRDDYPLSA